ncbi:pyridoxal 5'-phosphate synthase glutaminase subunit PdxT [Rodentibacter haemolyticus]|uniref:Pyridoxal 5'-phosphate synthase subunit PdxT n=1 Tax=Rodentibacter haemolyticus TaxID=2778911 RepID=A0ABX6UYR4_9PAST|nr:pyridoxal 5'-phosphate synthase glutaminase subunit PdxT [Rodentibacter haemolyticus]QPB42614.1 pyridoxal 5'-phosphate synthase glutaminase subunit PdxT [Rodentibacter haemolyticus]
MADYSQYTVGVLALQGAVSEHIAQLQILGAKARAVKKIEDFANLDALVLPGGESTAIGRLLRTGDLLEVLQGFNKPILGTCAGMILLAKEIEGETASHLDLMDIRVQRNAFGRQVDSFQTDLAVKGVEGTFPAVFIRAPLISKVSEQVEILAEFNGEIVLARQGNRFACSFHPELTNDPRIMKLLLDAI